MSESREKNLLRSVSQDFTLNQKKHAIQSTTLQMPPICKLQPHKPTSTSKTIETEKTSTATSLEASGTGMGEFQISHRRIGKGGGGEVLLGRRKPKEGEKGEKVAIKVLEKVNLNAEVRAKKEISVMHRLKGHNNIVRLMGAYESKTRIFLVMQYASGGDLMELIEREDRLHPAKAWIIFRQILKALLYAHGKGIAHRDMKPENVFFDKTGKVLLGDWGYACAWSSFKKKARACGSPQYAAPEILSCVRYTGPEVDMFSLGGVLYTMLTGKFPYTKISFRDMMDRVCKGLWNPDPTLSDSASDLLTRLLEPDPLKRATMYDVLKHEWITTRPDFVSIQRSHFLSFSNSVEKSEEDKEEEGESDSMTREYSSPLGGRKMVESEDVQEFKRKKRYF